MADKPKFQWPMGEQSKFPASDQRLLPFPLPRLYAEEGPPPFIVPIERMFVPCQGWEHSACAGETVSSDGLPVVCICECHKWTDDGSQAGC